MKHVPPPRPYKFLRNFIKAIHTRRRITQRISAKGLSLRLQFVVVVPDSPISSSPLWNKYSDTSGGFLWRKFLTCSAVFLI